MEIIVEYLEKWKYISSSTIRSIEEILLNDESISSEEIEDIKNLLLDHNLKYLDKELTSAIMEKRFISIDLLKKLKEYLEMQSNIDIEGIENIMTILMQNENALYQQTKKENKEFLEAISRRSSSTIKKKVEPIKTQEEVKEEPVLKDLSLKLDISFYVALLNEAEIYEEIAELLPGKNNDSCFDIISLLLVYYYKDLFEIKEFLKTDDDIELVKYRDQILNKIECIKRYRESLKKQDEKVEKQENILIFLTTDRDNVCVETDIERDIDSSNYLDVIQLIESIKNGTFKNVKQFTNDITLNGLSEVRAHPHQSRVAFKRLQGNIFVVLQAFVKKADKPLASRTSLQARYDLYKGKVDELKEKIKDPEFIEENKETYDRIKQLLLGQKGEKQDGKTNRNNK